ncbi:MAG: hypothetical protein SWO11_17795 [Thermodesulfobacteriota bacterium]|nr:hypothetical protein [Thermodesulfobacteriota bacterium]
MIDYAVINSDVPASNITNTADPNIWGYSMDIPSGNDGTATITITAAYTDGNNLTDSTKTFAVNNTLPVLRLSP